MINNILKKLQNKVDNQNLPFSQIRETNKKNGRTVPTTTVSTTTVNSQLSAELDGIGTVEDQICILAKNKKSLTYKYSKNIINT